MIRPALVIAAKDLRLTLSRGTGLVQALLLGLLLIFVFSLSRTPGDLFPAQAAAAVFWLSSLFCQVLVFNGLYSLEEAGGARMALLLAPMPTQAVWLGKGLAGLLLILAAQAIFIPASIAFLGQHLSEAWLLGLAGLFLIDLGLAALGSLLGALSQGQAGRESLLSIILFPLLIPLLLAGIRITTAAFSGGVGEGLSGWFGLAGAFDAIYLGASLLLFPFVYGTVE